MKREPQIIDAEFEVIRPARGEIPIEHDTLMGKIAYWVVTIVLWSAFGVAAYWFKVLVFSFG